MQNDRTWNILKTYYITTLLIIVLENHYNYISMFSLYYNQCAFTRQWKLMSGIINPPELTNPPEPVN